MINDSLDDLVVQSGIGWRNIAGNARPFVLKQAPVAIQIEIGSLGQAFHILQKRSIALVPIRRSMKSLRSI